MMRWYTGFEWHSQYYFEGPPSDIELRQPDGSRDSANAILAYALERSGHFGELLCADCTSVVPVESLYTELGGSD